MNRTLLALTMAALLGGAALSGCSPSQPQQSASTDPAPAGSVEPAAGSESDPAGAQQAEVAPEAFRFRIGSLDAWALKDGGITFPNDGQIFGVGEPEAQRSEVLAAAGLPTDALSVSIQPLLVQAGDRVLLFDTGAANAPFGPAGALQASMRAAGIEPAQVTDVFISHRHSDHTGGLLDGDGALAYPNAAIHLSAPEWEAFQADADSAGLVATIAPKVSAFQPNASIVPGVVTAVAVEGHTPGHTAYEIGSDDQRLLYIGDTAHHYVMSVQRPDWTVVFDGDAARGKASRRALLQRAADQELRIHAVHFPFPGLGQVRAQGDGFVWVAERY